MTRTAFETDRLVVWLREILEGAETVDVDIVVLDRRTYARRCRSRCVMCRARSRASRFARRRTEPERARLYACRPRAGALAHAAAVSASFYLASEARPSRRRRPKRTSRDARRLLVVGRMTKA